MAQLSVSFFGRFQAQVHGKPVPAFRTKKVQALLIYLAAAPATAHRRETIMTVLWPGMPDSSARANLRQILFLLRQAIPDFEESGMLVSLVIANRDTIQLNPQVRIESDLGQFTRLLDAVHAHPHPNLAGCGTCYDSLEQAVSTYQGDFLADFFLDDSNDFEDWAEINRQACRRKALDALETLAGIAKSQKDYRTARQYIERELEIDNLRESAYRGLMEILAINGQRAEALAVYENCKRLFADELGMSPAARTVQLYEKIQTGDLSLDFSYTQGIRGYDLKEVIGSGAYGVIHRAVQPVIGRDVAVKIIHPRFANDPAFIRRFESEAQTIARLEHPHIVPLYDYWRESDGAYLVMRLFRGGNLQAGLELGPWPLDRIQRLLDHIGPALEAAHRQGIVHRDIKPANILFDEDQNAYLSDFGIAHDSLEKRDRARDGEGTARPDYLSPEQLQDGPISPQTDIYSLGAILYEMLTGEKPFASPNSVKSIQNHLLATVPPVSSTRPDLPAEIDDVVRQATEKEPGKRFASVMAMAEAFRSAVAPQLPAREVSATGMHPDLPVANPYKGLRPYQQADALDFFGREALTAQLLNRIAESHFLAVVGPSGSGKSSVVKAGLIPALRQGAVPGSEDWYITEMAPGSHPFEQLEKALRSVAVNPPPSLVDPMQRDQHGMLRTIRRILPEGENAQLLLVIDQFEELFTLVSDEELRNHFLNSLLEAISAPRSPIRVVVTLRADFYDRPLQYQPLAEWFKQNTELVLPLNREELLWAIQEPARRVGARFENGLVAEILADVSGQAGGLPLMQYALTELFNARQNGILTREVYARSGGVLGATARRADEIFLNLASGEQKIIQQVFMHLVTLGEGVEDTRRRVRLDELQQLARGLAGLEGSSVLERILEPFSRARLLIFDHDPATREPTVEVAHEALFRSWLRLRDWLKDYREDIRLQRILAAAVGDWEAAGRDESFLLRGARLAQYETWLKHTEMGLMPREQEFLTESLAAQARQVEEENQRRQRELETAKKLAESEGQRAKEQTQAAARLRQRAWLLAGALVITLILGLAAMLAGQQAIQNEAIAERNAAVSQSLALASGAQVAIGDDNSDQALALALAANQYEDPPMFSQRVLYDVAAGPGTIRQIIGGGGWRWAMDVHPESHRVASGADDGIVMVWDYRSGEKVLQLEGGHGDSIGDVAFSPDGRYLLSGAYDDWMVLWDGQTGEIVRRFFNPTGDVNGIDISPDGRLAIAATEGGVATLWDLETGEQAGELVHNPEVQIISSVFHPGGRLAATGSEDGTVIVWDVSEGRAIQSLAVMEGTVFALDFSPDGGLLAAGGITDTVFLFETEDWQPAGRLTGHPDWVFGLDFSPDGSQLAVANRDGAVMLWQVAEQRLLYKRYGKEGRTLSVQFTDTGQVITSASTGNLRLWSITDNRLRQTFTTGNALISMDQTSDQAVSALGTQGSIDLLDSATGSQTLQISVQGQEVSALAFSPDDRQVVSALVSGTALNPRIDLVLWDLQSGQPIQTYKGHTQRIHRLVFSPDGETFLSVGDDRQVILWDASSAEVRFRFNGLTDSGNTVAFSPDGSRMAAGFGTFRFISHGEYLDNSIRVWDTRTGQELAHLVGHEDAVVSLAFSPDGQTLLSGSIDTTLRLWNLSDGTMIRQFDGHTSGVMSAAFSPDGRFAATGAQDGSLMVWDLASGEAARQIRAHSGVVHFVRFSGDGGTIWSGSEDGTIKVWNPILGLEQLFGWVTANRFAPELACDQRRLYGLTASCDG